MLPRKLIESLKQTFPEASVLNLYGSTESGLISSFSMLGESSAESDSNFSPVGRPFEHVEVYVLDVDGKKVPAGMHSFGGIPVFDLMHCFSCNLRPKPHKTILARSAPQWPHCRDR